MAPSLVSVVYVVSAFLLSYLFYHLVYLPSRNPLHELAGPPVRKFMSNHLSAVLDPIISPRVHELYTHRYGRSIRIRGIGPWDERLLTLDPVSLHHVLKNSTIYEKPWQSRRLITSLIGCGMLAAEGAIHKRQRRVSTPAFSVQNMRALIPLVFTKGNQLKARWMSLRETSGCEASPNTSIQINVCHWVSRATFDVIGLAGFDYDFNAIHNESNELFCAYKEMFEVAISQRPVLRTLLGIYLPRINALFPDGATRTVHRCQEVIHRVAGHLVQEKKRKIVESEKLGSQYTGRDLLSLLIQAKRATDLPLEHQISDEDLLHNVNTFMFAGSDTSSLSITWTLLLLTQHPDIQNRLRYELLSIAAPSSLSSDILTEEEIQSLYEGISGLPFFHNVIREALRLIPPVHSSIRVATQDDEIPTMYPIHKRNGVVDETNRGVKIAKGSFVHVAVEGFNLDKSIWGEDAWDFSPDRWDDLPPLVREQPGLFSNLLTFSAGPRSCIGMRFSLIEIKTFLYILLTNFIFEDTGLKIIKANVVLTRPYVAGKFQAGSQCPLLVSPYIPGKD